MLWPASCLWLVWDSESQEWKQRSDHSILNELNQLNSNATHKFTMHTGNLSQTLTITRILGYASRTSINGCDDVLLVQKSTLQIFHCNLLSNLQWGRKSHISSVFSSRTRKTITHALCAVSAEITRHTWSNGVYDDINHNSGCIFDQTNSTADKSMSGYVFVRITWN